ncbi:MAG: HAMP domain-containing histidine kinase [Gemmatimonadaceae bacterium]|jgi:signal transduction histidine kinase|nr:HAMP domain-containing histidine kinase [Gemmatimonadaceae bacterium]
MTLRLRLALWYGALAGLVVILSCVYGYAVHGRTHYEQLDVTLRQTGAHVRDAFVAVTTPAERHDVLQMAVALGAQVRLYGDAVPATGAPAGDETVPMPDIAAVLRGTQRPAWPRVASLAPSLEAHDSAPPGALGIVTSATGARWRVNVLPVPPGHGGLIVATSLAHLDASVAAFGRFMALMAVLGTLLTFAAGWLIAERALRPVGVLTATATDIAVSRAFSRRVPTQDRPDELGRLAHTFNAMLTSLEQAYATERRFVADASHELRAPLSVIQANLELLQRPSPMSAHDQAAAVRAATTEAERLRRLVTDLLVLARADAGIPIARADVALDTLVADAVVELQHMVRGQTLAVGTLAPLDVQGDRDRLRQLVVILLDNAFRYTPDGGRITVELIADHRDACIRVRDTGIGIAAHDLPHIFERFYRADPARQRDAGGTGLGLAIARWIAREHGGDVEVASAPGEGTTVTVRLPLVRTRVEEPTGSNAPNALTGVA